MRSFSQQVFLAGGLALALLVTPGGARADEIPREYRDTIKKGLDYLARSQYKDGHWEGVNGQYIIPCTALAGMAFLCEGSTIREGKYRDNIRRARDYLMERCQLNGLIGNPANPAEAGRYMYGHGFGLLFLSCVVGEEENAQRREKLVRICERAAKYSRDAQTNRGGWGYVSAKDGSNFDEGSVTITQVQGLRAARNAGIIVPNDAIKNAQKYLQDSTDSRGGVMYSLAFGGGGGGGRPALTAAAVACGFSFGEYKSDLVKKWLKFCQLHLGMPGDGRRVGHDEYTHYYYAQVVYVLGEDRFKKLFPDARSDEVLTWKKYRKAVFDEFKRSQSADGSWSGNDNWTARSVGGVYVTACFLTMMQLDKGSLPIYQR
jgi:hypothetical protein